MTRALIALICALFCAGEAMGQGPITRMAENDPAPPPMKFIPSDTRAKLSSEKDLKGRTRLSLELANERLASAETETQGERYDSAGLELGVYQALIADAIQFLQKQGRRDNKLRDNFKRIDLALREHTPRIEKIRRTTPAQSAVHVKAAIDFVRQSRTDALESFYGDTVLRDRPTEKTPPESQQATSVPDDPKKKP
jgi:hypothetical protein